MSMSQGEHMLKCFIKAVKRADSLWHPLTGTAKSGHKL